jgi:hypothetical protein
VLRLLLLLLLHTRIQIPFSHFPSLAAKSSTDKYT